ncbi:MAG: NADH-quinone oxidoreductase subunit C [Chloroflexi bacterium]|nr:NADH-quinone oxidoreductase subunit C [Chloroflexota bacterium]
MPGAVVSSDEKCLLVDGASVREVGEWLKTSQYVFDYLANLTSVDYVDFFEVIYNLVSLRHNHSLTLKTRCYERENPSVPSMTPVWRGAELQEREVYDLMGISFEGHPNLKRILLWEGFAGHPLRRDYL